MQIDTIGHSTRSFADFAKLLKAHAITALADVRRYPGSRRHPHFSRESLALELPPHGITYRWFPALGGRRSTKLLSALNGAWEVEAFHAYADYAQTEEFAAALAELEALARAQRTAFMCAEALWTRCHRRLIADALLARGWQVFHIMSPTRAEPHHYPEFARVDGTRVTYPALI